MVPLAWSTVVVLRCGSCLLPTWVALSPGHSWGVQNGGGEGHFHSGLQHSLNVCCLLALPSPTDRQKQKPSAAASNMQCMPPHGANTTNAPEFRNRIPLRGSLSGLCDPGGVKCPLLASGLSSQIPESSSFVPLPIVSRRLRGSRNDIRQGH
jgi:hypothetical protein